MKTGTISWCAALAVLAAALVFYNLPGPPRAEPTVQYVSDAPVGHEAGQQLPDFTLDVIGKETPFTLSEHRGKVTILNLWATWCTPCVNELPYFDQLLRAHPEEVSILAIHSDLITDDVAEYLSHYDYSLDFAVDETGEVISAMGGSTMLPQTVILNQRGEVTYNQVGSVTLEKLEQLIGGLL